MLLTNGSTMLQERHHPFNSLGKIIKGFCIPESELDSDDTSDEPNEQLAEAIVVDDHRSESIEISLCSKEDDYDAPPGSPAISASGKEMYVTPKHIREFKPELMETDAIDDVSESTETSSPKVIPSPTLSPVSLYSGHDGKIDQPISILKSPLEKAQKKRLATVESGRQLRVTRIIETAIFTLFTVGMTIFVLFQVENRTEIRFDSSHASFPVQFNFRESMESVSSISRNNVGASLGLGEVVRSVPKQVKGEPSSVSYDEVARAQKEEVTSDIKGTKYMTGNEDENVVAEHETENQIEKEAQQELERETGQEIFESKILPEIAELPEVVQVTKEEAKLEGFDAEKELDIAVSHESEGFRPDRFVQDWKDKGPDMVITSSESDEEELKAVIH